MINRIIENVEKTSLKPQETAPQFEIGDTVDVHTRIVEGDKERVQVFSGTVLRAQGTGQQSDDRVHDHHGGQLAAAQHVVAEA